MGKVMLIDLAICNGCHNCQIACKDEHVGNDWTPIAKPQPDTGQFWNKVINLERGTVPKVQVTYHHTICQHCEDAPCIDGLQRRTPSTAGPTASSSSTRRSAGATSSASRPAPTRTSSTSTTTSTSPRSAPSAPTSSTGAGPRPAARTPAPPEPSPSGTTTTRPSRRRSPTPSSSSPSFPPGPGSTTSTCPRSGSPARSIDPEADECLEGATVTATNRGDRRDAHRRSPTTTATSGSRTSPTAPTPCLSRRPGYLTKKLGPIDATAADQNVGDVELWKARAPADASSLIKTIIIHHLPDMNDLPAAERWFYRYHIPEVLRNQPVSYVSFRAVPPPPGAEAFGYYNYKVHENLNRGEGEKPLGLLTMSKEVVPLKVIMVNVPATPTEDFMGRGASFEEKTILRWLIAIRYPEGVSVEEARRLVRQRARQGSHAAAGAHPLLQLQGHQAAGGHGQGGAGVHASAVGGVVELAPHQRAVVREQQRLGGFGPHQPAGLHQAAVGDAGRAIPSWSRRRTSPARSSWSGPATTGCERCRASTCERGAADAGAASAGSGPAGRLACRPGRAAATRPSGPAAR